MKQETFLRRGANLDAAPSEIELILASKQIGLAVRTKRGHERGSVVENFKGEIGPFMLQHTLQISPFQHILDQQFVGYLMHSCDPNCVLDMQRLRLLALKDIESGTLLTIDYAVTEDELYRQFPCRCGASNCRHWITGRSETLSRDGRQFLASLKPA